VHEFYFYGKQPNVLFLHNCGIFVSDLSDRQILIKKSPKVVAPFSFLFDQNLSLVEAKGTSRLFAGPPYRRQNTVTSFFSAGVWLRFRCNAEDAAKAPLSKATG